MYKRRSVPKQKYRLFSLYIHVVGGILKFIHTCSQKNPNKIVQFRKSMFSEFAACAAFCRRVARIFPLSKKLTTLQ